MNALDTYSRTIGVDQSLKRASESIRSQYGKRDDDLEEDGLLGKRQVAPLLEKRQSAPLPEIVATEQPQREPISYQSRDVRPSRDFTIQNAPATPEEEFTRKVIAQQRNAALAPLQQASEFALSEKEFQDRVSGETSTWRDIPFFGGIGSSTVSLAAGMMQGVTDLVRIMGADNTFTQELSKEFGGYTERHQQRNAIAIARVTEDYGMGARAALTLGHTAIDIATFLASFAAFGAVGKGLGLTGKAASAGKVAGTIRGAQSPAMSLMQNFTRNSKSAAKFAAFRFATTPGDEKEKLEAASLAFAYRLTPGLSAGLSSNGVKVKLYDFMMNSGISFKKGQYEEAWSRGMEEAKQNGDEEHAWMYGATALIPVISSDAIFSSLTKTLKSQQDKFFTGVSPTLKASVLGAGNLKDQRKVVSEYIRENSENVFGEGGMPKGIKLEKLSLPELLHHVSTAEAKLGDLFTTDEKDVKAKSEGMDASIREHIERVLDEHPTGSMRQDFLDATKNGTVPAWAVRLIKNERDAYAIQTKEGGEATQERPDMVLSKQAIEALYGIDSKVQPKDGAKDGDEGAMKKAEARLRKAVEQQKKGKNVADEILDARLDMEEAGLDAKHNGLNGAELVRALDAERAEGVARENIATQAKEREVAEKERGIRLDAVTEATGGKKISDLTNLEKVEAWENLQRLDANPLSKGEFNRYMEGSHADQKGTPEAKETVQPKQAYPTAHEAIERVRQSQRKGHGERKRRRATQTKTYGITREELKAASASMGMGDFRRYTQRIFDGGEGVAEGVFSRDTTSKTQAQYLKTLLDNDALFSTKKPATKASGSFTKALAKALPTDVSWPSRTKVAELTAYSVAGVSPKAGTANMLSTGTVLGVDGKMNKMSVEAHVDHSRAGVITSGIPKQFLKEDGTLRDDVVIRYALLDNKVMAYNKDGTGAGTVPVLVRVIDVVANNKNGELKKDHHPYIMEARIMASEGGGQKYLANPSLDIVRSSAMGFKSRNDLTFMGNEKEMRNEFNNNLVPLVEAAGLGVGKVEIVGDGTGVGARLQRTGREPIELESKSGVAGNLSEVDARLTADGTSARKLIDQTKPNKRSLVSGSDVSHARSEIARLTKRKVRTRSFEDDKGAIKEVESPVHEAVSAKKQASINAEIAKNQKVIDRYDSQKDYRDKVTFAEKYVDHVKRQKTFELTKQIEELKEAKTAEQKTEARRLKAELKKVHTDTLKEAYKEVERELLDLMNQPEATSAKGRAAHAAKIGQLLDAREKIADMSKGAVRTYTLKDRVHMIFASESKRFMVQRMEELLGGELSGRGSDTVNRKELDRAKSAEKNAAKADKAAREKLLAETKVNGKDLNALRTEASSAKDAVDKQTAAVEKIANQKVSESEKKGEVALAANDKVIAAKAKLESMIADGKPKSTVTRFTNLLSAATMEYNTAKRLITPHNRTKALARRRKLKEAQDTLGATKKRLEGLTADLAAVREKIKEVRPESLDAATLRRREELTYAVDNLTRTRQENAARHDSVDNLMRRAIYTISLRNKGGKNKTALLQLLDGDLSKEKAGTSELVRVMDALARKDMEASGNPPEAQRVYQALARMGDEAGNKQIFEHLIATLQNRKSNYKGKISTEAEISAEFKSILSAHRTRDRVGDKDVQLFLNGDHKSFQKTDTYRGILEALQIMQKSPTEAAKAVDLVFGKTKEADRESANIIQKMSETTEAERVGGGLAPSTWKAGEMKGDSKKGRRLYGSAKTKDKLIETSHVVAKMDAKDAKDKEDAKDAKDAKGTKGTKDAKGTKDKNGAEDKNVVQESLRVIFAEKQMMKEEGLITRRLLKESSELRLMEEDRPGSAREGVALALNPTAERALNTKNFTKSELATIHGLLRRMKEGSAARQLRALIARKEKSGDAQSLAEIGGLKDALRNIEEGKGLQKYELITKERDEALAYVDKVFKKVGDERVELDAVRHGLDALHTAGKIVDAKRRAIGTILSRVTSKDSMFYREGNQSLTEKSNIEQTSAKNPDVALIAKEADAARDAANAVAAPKDPATRTPSTFEMNNSLKNFIERSKSQLLKSGMSNKEALAETRRRMDALTKADKEASIIPLPKIKASVAPIKDTAPRPSVVYQTREAAHQGQVKHRKSIILNERIVKEKESYQRVERMTASADGKTHLTTKALGKVTTQLTAEKSVSMAKQNALNKKIGEQTLAINKISGNTQKKRSLQQQRNEANRQLRRRQREYGLLETDRRAAALLGQAGKVTKTTDGKYYVKGVDQGKAIAYQEYKDGGLVSHLDIQTGLKRMGVEFSEREDGNYLVKPKHMDPFIVVLEGGVIPGKDGTGRKGGALIETVGEMDVLKIASIGGQRTTLPHEMAELVFRKYLTSQEQSSLREVFGKEDTAHAWATRMEDMDNTMPAPKVAKAYRAISGVVNMFRKMFGMPPRDASQMSSAYYTARYVEKQFKSGKIFDRKDAGARERSSSVFMLDPARVRAMGQSEVRVRHSILKKAVESTGASLKGEDGARGEASLKAMRNQLSSDSVVRDMSIASAMSTKEGRLAWKTLDSKGGILANADTAMSLLVAFDKTGTLAPLVRNFHTARQGKVADLTMQLNSLFYSGDMSAKEQKRAHAVRLGNKKLRLAGWQLLSLRASLGDAGWKERALDGRPLDVLALNNAGIPKQVRIQLTQRDIDSLPEVASVTKAVKAYQLYANEVGGILSREVPKYKALAKERGGSVLGFKDDGKNFEQVENWMATVFSGEAKMGQTMQFISDMGHSSIFQNRTDSLKSRDALQVLDVRDVVEGHTRKVASLVGAGRETYELSSLMIGRKGKDGNPSSSSRIANVLSEHGIKGNRIQRRLEKTMTEIEGGSDGFAPDATINSRGIKWLKSRQDQIRLNRPTTWMKMASSAFIGQALLRDPLNMARAAFSKMPAFAREEYDRNGYMVIRSRNGTTAYAGDPSATSSGSIGLAGKASGLDRIRQLPSEADQVAMRIVFFGVTKDNLLKGETLESKRGDQEFWAGVREKSNDIVSRTQPTYAPESRSFLQGNRDLFTVALTRYGTQRSKVNNFIAQEYVKAMGGGVAERQSLNRAVYAGVVQNSLILAAIGGVGSVGWTELMKALHVTDDMKLAFEKEDDEDMPTISSRISKRFVKDFGKSVISPFEGSDELMAITGAVIGAANKEQYKVNRALRGQWFASTADDFLKSISSLSSMHRASQRMDEAGTTPMYEAARRDYAYASGKAIKSLANSLGFLFNVPLPGAEQATQASTLIRRKSYLDAEFDSDLK